MSSCKKQLGWRPFLLARSYDHSKVLHRYLLYKEARRVLRGAARGPAGECGEESDGPTASFHQLWRNQELSFSEDHCTAGEASTLSQHFISCEEPVCHHLC